MSDVQQPLDTNEVSIADENPELEITQESNQVTTQQDEVGTTTHQTGTTETGGEVTDIDVQAQGETADVSVDLTHLVEKGELTEEQLEKINTLRTSIDKIKCSEFHHKGTVQEYMAFLQKLQTVEQSERVSLDLDLSQLDSFITTVEELYDIMLSVNAKVKVVNQVDDTLFLDEAIQKVSKIEKLVEALNSFKINVAATSKLSLPASTHHVATMFKGLLAEVKCATNYINYFSGATTVKPSENADMSAEDKLALQKAVDAIDLWKNMVENGVTSAMAANEHVKDIKETVGELSKIDLTVSRNILRNLQGSLANNSSGGN